MHACVLVFINDGVSLSFASAGACGDAFIVYACVCVLCECRSAYFKLLPSPKTLQNPKAQILLIWDKASVAVFTSVCLLSILIYFKATGPFEQGLEIDKSGTEIILFHFIFGG